ncbi:hypothetical protein Acr_17g0013810 [Actinidia rufa]|uniref:Gag protease polyprotein n=1 Tax=Actinidia rufa TaxID=165716 RepID=A0A7J0G4V1_9ERIC|nr:hypothetical protein Acr_17g0013810 [Actinidia rufa]
MMEGTPLGRGTKVENSGCGCGCEEKGRWLPDKHSHSNLYSGPSSSPSWGRARSLGRGRGRVEGASSASSVSGGHDEAPHMFHFTPEALREFVRAIRDEIQQLPPPPPVAVEPVVHKAPAEPRAQSAMREFRRQDPPRFSREPDPIEAELWLKRINLAFEMIELDEDVLRIRAATYQFSGPSAHLGLRPGLRGKVVSFELNTFEEGNSLRGKDRSIRSDSNSPPILSHSSLSSRGLPFSTSLGVHISQVHPEVDPVRGRDFATSVDKRATSRLFAHNFRHRDRISSPDNHSWGINPLVLPFQHQLHHLRLREPVLLVVSSSRHMGDSPDSSTFAFALGLEVDLLDSTLLVDTPVGGVVPLNRVCHGCVLVIADRRIEADLVVMDMSGFDIILGMDWLSSNRAIVDCFRRRVTITISSGDSFYFVGDRLDFSTSSLHHLRGRDSILPGT